MFQENQNRNMDDIRYLCIVRDNEPNKVLNNR